MRTPARTIGGRIFLGIAVLAACGGLLACRADAAWAGGEVRIGVLANSGVAKCLEEWSGLADRLTARVPGRTFRIVPVPFSEVDAVVSNRQVDFIVVNPSIYIRLDVRYKATRIATLVNNDLGARLDHFGGVIFTRAGRADIAGLADLKGRRFVAVDPTSLGGWLAPKREFVLAGLCPERDFAGLEFVGSHRDTVKAVLAGAADAGATRTDTLERMARAGEIDLAAVKVLKGSGAAAHSDFPFLFSTAFYPEWALARLDGTSEELARKVAAELFLLPSNGDCGGKTWTIPLSYEPVREMLKALCVDPFANDGKMSVRALLAQHAWAAAGIAVAVMCVAFSAGYFSVLNKRLRQAQRELTIQANTDDLTKLLNRRRFNDVIDAEIVRATRYGRPLSLLLLDLDDFKKLNDAYGHPTGDEMLVVLAESIRSLTRKTDSVARIGGEEFAVLLPETDLGEALRAAERIREKVAATSLLLGDGTALTRTVSVGVADVCASIQSCSDLYRAADEALYEAKALGKNRVCRSSRCLRYPPDGHSL